VADVNILHAQVEATKDGVEPEVDLPPFLDIEKRLGASDAEKGDEEKYSAYQISLINKIPVIRE